MRRSIRGLIACFLLVCVAGFASAADLRMYVNGELGIDPQGKVYQTNITTILTPQVKALVEKTVIGWQFEPVLRDGKPVYAKTDMTLHLLAKQVEGGYRLEVENVRFRYGSRRAMQMPPPRYPKELARLGVSGDVLVALRIGADGKVVDAVAVQVSLPYANAKPRHVEQFGQYLAKSAVAAAREWRFLPADAALGEESDATQVVPVSYRMDFEKDLVAAANGWQVRPGAKYTPIPWLPAQQQAFDPSGLRQGEGIAVGKSLTLKTNVVGTQL